MSHDSDLLNPLVDKSFLQEVNTIAHAKSITRQKLTLFVYEIIKIYLICI